jgi:hypothetical protein
MDLYATELKGIGDWQVHCSISYRRSLAGRADHEAIEVRVEEADAGAGGGAST